MNITNNLTIAEQDALNRELYLAIVNDDVERVDKIIQEGADPNANYDGSYPLEMAVLLKKSIILIESLIKNGVNINVQDKDGYTPLHDAVSFGKIEAIEFLIEQGANLDAKNKLGKTPLDYATGNNETESIEILLKYGANYDILKQGTQADFFDYPHIFKLFAEAISNNSTKFITNLLKFHQEFREDASYLASLQNNTEMSEFIMQQELPITKINHAQFARLLGNRTTGNQIIVKTLLDQYGFNNDLSSFRFNASTYVNISSLDFSNVDLSNSKLYQLKFNQTNFVNSNLTNTNILFANNKAVVNFTSSDLTRSFINGLNITNAILDQAVIKDTMIFGSSSYRDKINEEHKNEIIDLTIDSKFRFYQGQLTSKYLVLNRDGICLGLSVEYAIYQMTVPLEKRDNFINELILKINNKDVPFLYRVQSYHKTLQSQVKDNRINVDIKEVLNNNFITSLSSEFQESKIIGCSFLSGSAGHIFAIAKLHNHNSEVFGYKIFDSNYGEITCANETELNQKVNYLFQYYQQDLINRESYFKVIALDKMILEHDLLPSNNEDGYDGKRYSLMSDLEKLHMILEDKKANSTYINWATDIINTMSLEEINAPINRGKDGHSFLILLAAYGAKLDVVNLLIAKGADINVQTHKGFGALSLAVHSGNSTLINTLIHNGINITHANNNNQTALHYAASYGNVEIVENLIYHGSNIDLQDNFGQTALLFAVIDKHLDVVTVLIKHGANPYLERIDGYTAVNIAPEYFTTEVIGNIFKAALDQNDQLVLNNLTKHYHQNNIQTEVLVYAISNDIVEKLPENLKAMVETDEICYNPFFLPYFYDKCEYSF